MIINNNKLVKAEFADVVSGICTVPMGITEIGSYAFAKCASLKEIVLPSTVIKVGNHAFSDCINLKSVEIGKNTTTIFDSAFKGCKNLIEVVLSENCVFYGAEAFSGCESLKSFIFPEKTNAIGEGMFRNCSSLRSVVLPETMGVIPRALFNGCKSLRAINIPRDTYAICSYAFSGCESLHKVSGVESILIIGERAFENCKELTTLKIMSIKEISRFAFLGSGLKSTLGFYKLVKNSDEGYKGRNDFIFDIGKKYHCDGKISCSENGFHYCENLYTIFNHYGGVINEDVSVLRVHPSGTINNNTRYATYSCSDIEIQESITLSELVKLFVRN